MVKFDQSQRDIQNKNEVVVKPILKTATPVDAEGNLNSPEKEVMVVNFTKTPEQSSYELSSMDNKDSQFELAQISNETSTSQQAREEPCKHSLEKPLPLQGITDTVSSVALPERHKVSNPQQSQTVILMSISLYDNQPLQKHLTLLDEQTKPEPEDLKLKTNFDSESLQSSHKDELISSPKVPKHRKQCLSRSVLGPANKNYLQENSLFFRDREAVLVFGGVDPHIPYGSTRNIGKDMYRFLPHSNSWETIGDLPEPRHFHSVAFFEGRVYLAGGADPRHNDMRGRCVVVSTVWSYEPVSRAWFSETGMLTPRKNFGLVVSSGKLYAIGGQNRQGIIISSVECYDPKTGNWQEVAPTKVPRSGMACAKFQEKIWVAGGITNLPEKLTATVECYDSKQNEWSFSAPLRFPRCFVRLSVMNGDLYIIGGAGQISHKVNSVASIADIDVWDHISKTWKHKTELVIPRHGHSMAYIGSQLIILGGVTTTYMRALNNVECYCCARQKWIRGINPLPIAMSSHAAVTLPPASLL